MSRLFIGTKEIDFFNDISKELTKDIVGQKIYYYPISLEKTKPHRVYEEAIQKVFDNPIEINCMVDWQPSDITTTQFGHDSTANITVYIQSRDMKDKKIELKEGGFFTYGAQAFEITKVRTFRNIYGNVEYDDGIELTGKQARKDVFSVVPSGPTEEEFSDSDAVQETFIQQRGFEENREGKTGDRRDLVDKGRIDAPDITAPAEISPRGSSNGRGSGFYGEGD